MENVITGPALRDCHGMVLNEGVDRGRAHPDVAAYFNVGDSFFGDEAFDEADAHVEAFGYLVFVEEWVGVPEGELVHSGSFHRRSDRDRVCCFAGGSMASLMISAACFHSASSRFGPRIDSTAFVTGLSSVLKPLRSRVVSMARAR
jgi:hypothetical protein